MTRIKLVVRLSLLVITAAILSNDQAIHAQSITTIRYDDNRIADIPADEAALFSFSIETGVTIVEVWGVDIAPSVAILNAQQTETLVEATNPEVENRVVLEFDNSGDILLRGNHIISVTGPAGISGAVAVRLTLRESSVLAVGNTIQLGQSFTASVIPGGGPAVYQFEASPDTTLQISVRSITEGFSPVVTVLDTSGVVIDQVSSTQTYGASYILKPAEGNYQLAVDLGEFSDTGEFAVNLELGPTVGNDGTVGFEVPPESSCSLTADTQVNIRSGGSVDHDAVGVLGRGKYLIVIGYSTDNDTWYAVSLPDASTGWIASTVTRLVGSCENLPLRSYLPPS
ncbi:MAG: SH3 domain-containing protein [Chloroflexi bacterium]|nr:SH3 domain-containing protein [Chloroflexota bacterium]